MSVISVSFATKAVPPPSNTPHRRRHLGCHHRGGHPTRRKACHYVHRGEGRVEVNLQGAQRRLWRLSRFTSATATTQRR